MKYKLICPYKSKYSRFCDHKQGRKQKTKKKICPYKNQAKCPLYIEWLEIKKSCSRMAKNGYGDYNEGIDDSK